MELPTSGILAVFMLRDQNANILENQNGNNKNCLRYVNDIFAIIKEEDNLLGF